MENEKTEKNSILTIVKDEDIEKELGTDVKKEEVPKPTPEDVEKCKTDFSDALKDFENQRWQISEPGQFGINDVGLYLLDYMNKYAFWSKTEWMGMIKMEDEVRKAMAVSDPSVGIALNYQALEFCAYMLANPGGTGIKLAKEFEVQADKYAKIGMVVGAQIEEARKKLKELQTLQEKWGYYAQLLADEELVKSKEKEAEEKPEEEKKE
jgi:hypothetical protein